MERAMSAGASNSNAPNVEAHNSDNGQPIDNAQRIRDKQFEQAEHLREAGQANGNERLNDTADRMESNGQYRYQRRIEGIEQMTRPAPESLAPEATVGGKALPNIPNLPAPAAQRQNSWLPSWFRARSR
jgi:hypothetical protein